jgi:hypothetical protein
MKKNILIILCLIPLVSIAQPQNTSVDFWEKLQNLCGKSFEGKITEAPENDSFRSKKLVMQVKSCETNQIRIPFYVGEDKSRTWVLTYEKGLITLKHDHRHEDGTPDSITLYGGTSSNTGLATIQIFPADQQTHDLLPYASTNVWWITLDDKTFTYNLRRLGTDRVFSVSFDLTKPIECTDSPWGWKD